MQYHYISDNELYHFGRSKRDGAPIGSGRYPLGSGDSRYERKIADRIARDFSTGKYKNTVTQALAKSSDGELNTRAYFGDEEAGSAAHTLFDEKTSKKKKNYILGKMSGIGIAALGVGSVAAGALTGMMSGGMVPIIAGATALASVAGDHAVQHALNTHSDKRLDSIAKKYFSKYPNLTDYFSIDMPIFNHFKYNP